jgi:hypothetical protein
MIRPPLARIAQREYRAQAASLSVPRRARHLALDDGLTSLPTNSFFANDWTNHWSAQGHCIRSWRFFISISTASTCSMTSLVTTPAINCSESSARALCAPKK